MYMAKAIRAPCHNKSTTAPTFLLADPCTTFSRSSITRTTSARTTQIATIQKIQLYPRIAAIIRPNNINRFVNIVFSLLSPKWLISIPLYHIMLIVANYYLRLFLLSSASPQGVLPSSSSFSFRSVVTAVFASSSFICKFPTT